ncbi:DUF6476 family protein [Xinfangfangia pollutisoli]|uniref:DUF6476 family protein n=1 Tax=Xinfangfangia pollutisoli TaxID=2865960 RepID=UPI001CD3CE9D|nr:DUF6476 family protein [Xinfangfangia pollutisoli]
MADAPDGAPLPRSLRLLQALVILLTLSMIAGVITVVWLLVTRMPGSLPAPAAGPRLPADLALPAGETASAVTFGEGWSAVVTRTGRILVYDAKGVVVQDISAPALPAD